MAYKPRIPSGRSACRSCECMRCSSISCEWETFYKCYPAVAGCVRCMDIENDKPIKGCPNFRFRTDKKMFVIRLKRKNPYIKLARSLHSVIQQLQRMS